MHTNCFEVTIELSCDKFPHESELPQEWENNKESLLLYMEQVTAAAEGYHPVTRTCHVSYENSATLCDFRLTKTPKQRLREILAKGGKVPKDLALRLRRLRLRQLEAQRQAQ
ncbi:hypothetical protein Chor_001565 [Crotalus horridus]